MQLFDAEFYIRSNPDLAAALANGDVASAEAHFLEFGQYENRAPSAFFDPVLYLRANPDVQQAVQSSLFASAFDHLQQFGASEVRDVSAFFNSSFYLATNPDIAGAVERGEISAFEHFIQFGQSEQRDISPFFDTEAYLAANPDVATAIREGATTAYAHFVQFGILEGRDLGNGISLQFFANDPAASAAIEAGDFQALFARVAEVAPFIPGFVAPAGYTIPDDQPIPAHFVAPAGQFLVIPEGVTPPTQLPPSFQQPTPPPGGGETPTPPPGGGGNPNPNPNPDPNPDPEPSKEFYGDLSTKATFIEEDQLPELYAGTGNPANGFYISRNEASNIELALDVRYTGDPREIGPVGDTQNTFKIDEGTAGRFAWSVSTIDGKPLNLDAYDIFLSVDTDPSANVDYITFKLGADAVIGERDNRSDSEYDWVRVADTAEGFLGIYDDGGNAAVSQNIHAFHWYSGESSVSAGDQFVVRLYATVKDDSSDIIADSQITVNVVGISSIEIEEQLIY